MSVIKTINSLNEKEREEIYSLLIPPSIFTRFKINPHTFKGARGKRCVFVASSEKGFDASIIVKKEPEDKDPIFLMEVEDSRDIIQLFWGFININDPDAPRFNTDVDQEGRDRWMNWRSRNIEEEVRALKAGLAPGQVRRGLRLMHEVNSCIDRFGEATNLKSIFLEALFYHNAIIYERHGFRYFEGEKRMRKIHEEFQPGGKLYKRLDRSTPFRQPSAANTVRGRSWAIHDGVLDEIEDDILDEPWFSPKMYRMIGKYYNIDTFPGGPY